MRLFIAIELDDAAKSVLASASETLCEASVQGTFTRRENYHLTLVFLGELSSAAPVRRAMQAVHCSPFTLQINGSGVFRRNGGDIYWAGLEKSEPLSGLYDAMTNALRAQRVAFEDRPYKPHLTLGRQVIVKKNALHDFQSLIPKTDVKVNAITLMRSDRTNGKLIYTPIFRQTLTESKM